LSKKEKKQHVLNGRRLSGNDYRVAVLSI